LQSTVTISNQKKGFTEKLNRLNEFMNRIILLNSVYTKKRRVPYWNQIGGQANGGVVRSIHGKSITR
jgi:hypothetical protein